MTSFRVTINGDRQKTHFAIDIYGPDTGTNISWQVPEEVPVAFVYNRRNYAVLLATPDNLTEYAVGFSISEGVIDAPCDITQLDIHNSDLGIELRLKLKPTQLEKFDILQRRRNLPGNSGCGLCGLENADSLHQALPQVTKDKVELDHKVILKALSDMKNHQPINAATRSIHGAFWADMDGTIKAACEDVGRHNALDKLLGALVLSEQGMSGGFVLMSSRCSYELIEKAARVGVQAMVFLSGPTGFALRKAHEANIAIYARAGDGIVELNRA